MNHARPGAQDALRIAAEVTGDVPTKANRFETGARHYVYEVGFLTRPPIVVRMGDETAGAEMAGAVYLSELLRPRGVPLPAMLAASTEARAPWVVLERLPGTDLGAVIGQLSISQLERIAARVADAQAIVAKTKSARRYGYAVLPEQAPYGKWSQALDAALTRSKSRIADARLFDGGSVDLAQRLLDSRRHDLDCIEATPFLHDTTTRNVIVDSEGEFSGIVDVDDLGFGDARYPAALTLAVLLVSGGPTDYVSAWLKHSEMPDDRTFRLYVVLFLLDLMSEHGHAFNGNEPPSTLQSRAVLQDAFENALRRVQDKGD